MPTQDAENQMPSTAAPIGSARVPLALPRMAIVGCGRVGELHRERLLQEPVEIVAVCDPDADALSRMARDIPRRPRLFRSEQDLLAAGIADAVILCTPHGYHAEQARSALDAGVHVLCEKPFVTRLEDAEDLVARARDKNLALYVAYTRRSRGHVNFLLEAATKIGPLTNVIITRTQPWLQTHRRTWRMHEAEGGGFLLDAGASMLDLLLRLTESTVEEIDARLTRPIGSSLDVDARAVLHLAFYSGTRAEVTLLGDATEFVEQIQLFGERGTAGWMSRQDVPDSLYIRTSDPDGAPGNGLTVAGDVHPYRTRLPDEAFVAALRSDRDFRSDASPDLYDAATAVPVVALVERIYHEATWQ